MNARSFDRILQQVLLVPMLAVLLGTGALLWQMKQANSTVAEMQQADQSIAETLLIERLVDDQETGLRGFQTTRDQVFLEPYRAADRQLPAALDRRRALASGPASQTAIDALQAAHESWQEGFAKPLIAAVQAGAQTNDIELNLRGKRQMDQVRRLLAGLMTSTETRRDLTVSRWRHQVRVLLAAMVIVSIAVGLLIGLFVRRQVHTVSDAFRQSHDALRLRAEQTFRSEQKLRTTLQSIGDGVITCDAEARVDAMNDVACDLTGWTAADARGLPLDQVFNIISESTREVVENPVAKVKRLNRVVGLANHTILIRKDGSELFIDDSGAPIRDNLGNMTGVVLVFRDISVSKKSQEALLANEKLAVAGRLAATIAHEIHNPLDSVSNLLFLMDGKSTPEETKHFLKLAKGEIERVTMISRAMLSLYRESRAPVAINVRETLCSILLLMERKFEMLSVKTVTDVPEDLSVHGFPAELRQVFTNLLTNAGEASPPGGTIAITARAVPAGSASNGVRRADGVMITISDQGPGIPEAIRADLFKPFFTTKGERGTGLGLWVSRGIMTRQGGSIELTSSEDAQDHGTTAHVFLATNPLIHPGGD